MSTKLRELQEKLYIKQNNIATIYEQAKRSDGTYDFTKADVFEHLDDNAACLDMLKQLEAEQDAIYDEVKTLQDIHEREQKIQKQMKDRKKITEPHTFASTPSNGQGGPPVQQKSLGEMIRDAWPEERPGARGIYLEKEFKNFELKALMMTTAGWAPEVTRIPRVAEFAHPALQIIDLFPVGTTTQSAIQYMEETTSLNTAQETAEGAPKPEAELVFTQREVMIRKIAVYLPVTDEQLADVDQVASLVDARLRYFVQRRLDTQLINGNGAGVNIRGLLASGIQTHARGADPIADAVYKGMVLVRTVGEALPSAIIMHPDNFANVRLMKTADGQYIWGPPSEVGPMRLFGVPVVDSSSAPLNTAIVGDFANFAQLWMRQGVEVMAGYINDDFIRNQQSIRAELRAALAVYRPNAFCAVTGLNI